jgi:hypothetical protein
MMRSITIALCYQFFCLGVLAQAKDSTMQKDSIAYKDSTIQVGKHYIVLSEIIVNNKLNVPAFIKKVEEDTTFYKAFRNLDILGYTSFNDIRMLDKKENTQASLYSKTKQIVQHGCRTQLTLQKQVTGDMYDSDSAFNYLTGEMYGSLFLTKGTVCGENNIVGTKEFSTEGKSGIEKHKEQLKMLFFDPGKRIPGIPFLSSKTAIFDDDMAADYDMSIDMGDYNKTNCYIFSIKVKAGSESDVAIDSMTTWFDANTFEVLARNYALSYDAGVYDFNVAMEVQLTHYKDYLVPGVIRYNGNFKIIFKSRERGVFTATLFDYTDQ